jgi:hypothetical protein
MTTIIMKYTNLPPLYTYVRCSLRCINGLYAHSALLRPKLRENRVERLPRILELFLYVVYGVYW